MTNEITKNYRLHFDYGVIRDFSRRQEFLTAIDQCIKSDAQVYLSEKTNYGKLLSILKTMPFSVAILGLYGKPNQAAEEWEKSCARKFSWFRTPYFEFHKDGEVGDDHEAYHEFLESEAHEFCLLVEKFIMAYRQELKDYMKMLCNEYGPHVAFESFIKCVKKYSLTPSIVDIWCFKVTDMLWNYKNHIQFVFKQKKTNPTMITAFVNQQYTDAYTILPNN